MVQTITNNLHWIFEDQPMETHSFDSIPIPIPITEISAMPGRSNSPSDSGSLNYQPEGVLFSRTLPPVSVIKKSSQVLNPTSPPTAITFYPDQYLDGVHSSSPQTASHAFHREHLLRKEVVHILLQECSPRISLVRQEGGRSHVWSKFRIVMVDGKKTEYAACTQCLSVLTYRVRDGTSGLLKHVCSYHSAKHAYSNSPCTKQKPDVPDLVERMGHSLSATTSGSMGQTLGGGGGGSGVRCKSEEALGTAGSFSSGLAGGDHDDVDGQRVEDDVTVEPEFLHDPLDVKTHIPGMATITSQAMISPLLSPPSSSAAPLRLSQHHRLPPTTGSATNNSTEENNIQPESVSARITTSPPQPQGLAGPYLLKKETHCTTVLDQLLRDETFTDVTLTAEGQSIRAHRVVLCLASAYFRQVLSHDQNVHSVVILRDIKFAELKNIIHFIYTGEATVDASELESFMKTAEILEISSLCEGHKSISTAGLVSQSYGSGFNIGEFERLMGTKRNRKDAPPMPSKNRKISGEQSSRSSTPVGISATSVTVVKEEPIEHDSSKMHTDEPVYRGSGKKSKGILEDPPTFGSKSLSTTTTFETGEMEAMEEGSNSGGDGKSDTSGRSSPSATMLPDITTVPGRCPYCPHLNQEFRGVSMMRHLLVSHPCKPAFPCDNCFRVFVRKGQYRAHQAKCNDV